MIDFKVVPRNRENNGWGEVTGSVCVCVSGEQDKQREKCISTSDACLHVPGRLLPATPTSSPPGGASGILTAGAFIRLRAVPCVSNGGSRPQVAASCANTAPRRLGRFPRMCKQRRRWATRF